MTLDLNFKLKSKTKSILLLFVYFSFAVLIYASSIIVFDLYYELFSDKLT